MLKWCIINIVARSWPRVQSAHQKPHWIHVDFEHFEDEEDEEEEEKEEEKEEEVDPEKRERIVSGKGKKKLHTQYYILHFSLNSIPTSLYPSTKSYLHTPPSCRALK